MARNVINIDKVKLKELILEGKTLRELSSIFQCSDALISRRKRDYALVGLTPNNKKKNPVAEAS